MRDIKAERETGRLVVVVGSGVSSGATGGNPVTEWAGLLRHGIRFAQKLGLDTEVADLALRKHRFVTAAQEISDLLARCKEFGHWLQDAFGGLAIMNRGVIDAILGLKAPVATTNYDRLLEDASGMDRLTWLDSGSHEQWRRGNAKSILHLHGHFLDQQSVILAADSYDRVVNNEPARAFLASLFHSNTVLFVGCGDAGLTDPNIGSLFDWMARMFPNGRGGHHYRAVPDGAVAATNEFHRTRNHMIHAVGCGPTWDDLPKFLSTLVTGELSDVDSAPCRSKSSIEPVADAVHTYRNWALEKYRTLHLVGLGAQDIDLDLDRVFVPLRLHDRSTVKATALESFDADPSDAMEPRVDIARLFVGLGSGSLVVVLGEPGTGKTTVATKLLVGVLRDVQCGHFGLPPGTIAVFLQLRFFAATDANSSLGDMLDREFARDGAIGSESGLGTHLWNRGRLLVIADGLDEIATADLRTKARRCLERELRDAKDREVRLLVTSREASYTGDSRFREPRLTVAIQKLDDTEQRNLVMSWYSALRTAYPDHPSGSIEAERDDLIRMLESPPSHTQRLRVLLSTPLLLSLLCVQYRRGRTLPHCRAAFFEKSLEVLLQIRPSERGHPPPLPFEHLKILLARIADEMQRPDRNNELSHPEFSRWTLEIHAKAGLPTRPAEVATWLREHAGLLRESGPAMYGFAHAQIREYLVAVHAATAGSPDDLAGHLRDARWEDILNLYAEVAGEASLGRFLTAALNRCTITTASPRERRIVRGILDSDVVVSETTLLQALSESDHDVDRIRRLLEVVPARRVTPRMYEGLRKCALSQSCPEDVKREVGLLGQELRRRQDPVCRYDFFVAHSGDDRDQVERLIRELENGGLRVWPTPEQINERPDWRRAFVDAECETRAGLVVVGSDPAALLRDGFTVAVLEILERRGCPVIGLRLSSRPATPLPRGFPSVGSFLRRYNGRNRTLLAFCKKALDTIPVPSTTEEASTVPPVIPVDEAPNEWIVSIPDADLSFRFLAVPGGPFVMGGDLPTTLGPIARGASLPSYPVDVRPFWLAATPVTNRQFGVYMEEPLARRPKEPRCWRDRNFSDPDQPVVGVSWDDAKAFCSWLQAKLSNGVRIRLPFEVEREFATRGTDSRLFAWGSERPDEQRACFGKAWQRGPDQVGVHVLGRGPFGHDDLAGNVWEWCEDVWDAQAYEKHLKGPRACAPRDNGWRSMRGGAFGDIEAALIAYCREGGRRGDRSDDVGFRIVADAAPEGGTTNEDVPR